MLRPLLLENVRLFDLSRRPLLTIREEQALRAVDRCKFDHIQEREFDEELVRKIEYLLSGVAANF